ncbi:hypothetical protein T4E_6863 [Trichinella pseudospiralis]|uniref:Uncharacterized protein n=1 Tax=Trichinella pseudospiralis TaxID=6337 RepID=A0A0V0XJ88_TRIPS|nr:hypothetical protein T4E_6863 [Trichinella pseudospiralis]
MKNIHHPKLHKKPMSSSRRMHNVPKIRFCQNPIPKNNHQETSQEKQQLRHMLQKIDQNESCVHISNE